MTPRIAIIAADFNKGIVDPMIETAQADLAAAGATLDRVVRVAGAYELPLIADALFPKVDALVCLGYIERGQTLHGEVMGHVVHAALVELQLRHKKPAGLGIIGPGATPEQAEVRKIGSAKAAVAAALDNLHTLRGLA